jgi:hypothetical protein
MRLKPVILLLMASGCQPQVESSAPFRNEGVAAPVVSKPLSAVLSCRIGQAQIGLSACLIGSGRSASGRLKIRSGAAVRQFTDVDILTLEHRASGPTVSIPLTRPFEISAQANGEPQSVLRVEVREGSNVIDSDEAGAYALIRLNDL